MKAPVLDKWEVAKRYGGKCLSNDVNREIQRDADMEWFKKQGHDAISYLEGYQQARIEVVNELFNWVIKYKGRYSKKKEMQAEKDPSDIQSQAMLGTKIKALQGVIDKLRSMQ